MGETLFSPIPEIFPKKSEQFGDYTPPEVRSHQAKWQQRNTGRLPGPVRYWLCVTVCCYRTGPVVAREGLIVVGRLID